MEGAMEDAARAGQVGSAQRATPHTAAADLGPHWSVMEAESPSSPDVDDGPRLPPALAPQTSMTAPLSTDPFEPHSPSCEPSADGRKRARVRLRA
eukprot:364234-Chlamydomonas_euryale.AAC.4